MPDNKKCTLCSGEDCLTTLGQYCLCASCRLSLLRQAVEFAKRNTVRNTVYHAAFTALGDLLADETQDFI